MNRTESDHTLELDPDNPWLGLSSYTEASRAYFHGRDEEAAELARRVQRRNLTILFGQSGLGKTSLLRAGLVPRLRPQGYCPVYVRVDYAPDSPEPAEQIKQALRTETTREGVWSRQENTVEGESLWEFLHHRGDLLRDAGGQPLVPLLIFDQFEEVFTLAQADDAGRARAHAFLSQLADLVENRPPEALEERLEDDDSIIDEFDFARADYRILIALREDYLAHLESIKDLMPSITQNRMRLARMTGPQALSAVVEPGGKLVSREVAEAIVRFVAGGSELANAEIEPSLLSLVCRELNTTRIAQGRPEISADLLAGSRDTILSEFYERALADQPPGVRRVIEDELLTESGYRESLAEERVRKALDEAGTSPDALANLVNRRLLRIEDRLDMRRVELTHDVLCGVVLASRNVRHEREERDAAQRQLAEQKAREQAAHRAMLRARTVAAVCAVLMVIAIAGALFGWLNYRRAQTAESQAQASRANAENLVGFLIEDFYNELAPTGRLEILGKLARKTVAYYNGLPASLVTPQTRINRAMAILREGQAEQAGGKVKIARKLFQEGHAVFDALWKKGRHSEEVAYGLALSLYAPVKQNTSYAFLHAKDNLGRASMLLKPRVESGDARPQTRLLYASVLNDLSHTQPPKQAVQTCNTALAVLKGLGALDLGNLDATSLYADVADSQARRLMSLGRLDDGERIERTSYTLANRLLHHRPGDLHALMDRIQSAQLLAQFASRRHDSDAALKFARRAVRSAEEEVHFNPSSVDAWADLTSALDQLARIQADRGDISEAIVTLQRATDMVRNPAHPLANVNVIMNTLFDAAMLQMQIGDHSGLSRAIQGIREGRKRITQELSPDNPLNSVTKEFVTIYIHWLKAWQQNRFGPLIAQTDRTLRKLQDIHVPAGSRTRMFVQNAFYVALGHAAFASLETGKYKKALDYMRRRQEFAPLLNVDTSLPSIKANHNIRLALALAGLGRKAEARAHMKSALAYYRKQNKLGPGGIDFHLDFAAALYVDALAQSSDPAGRSRRRSDLAKAAHLIATAPGQGPELTNARLLAQKITMARHAH